MAAEDALLNHTMQAVGVAARLLEPLQLEELLEAFERADAVGHVLDPTAWRRSRLDREHAQALLRAALRLRAVYAEALEGVPRIAAHRAACDRLAGSEG